MKISLPTFVKLFHKHIWSVVKRIGPHARRNCSPRRYPYCTEIVVIPCHNGRYSCAVRVGFWVSWKVHIAGILTIKLWGKLWMPRIYPIVVDSYLKKVRQAAE